MKGSWYSLSGTAIVGSQCRIAIIVSQHVKVILSIATVIVVSICSKYLWLDGLGIHA